MTDWVKDTQDKLESIRESAKLSLTFFKDEPFFDKMIEAYVTGYIQCKTDTVTDMLNMMAKRLKSDLDDCDCEDCQEIN